MKIRKIPRGTFWIGGLAAVALAIPLLSLGLYALAPRFGRVDPSLTLDRIFWISLIFAGIPALLTGGGVARLCAHRLAERPEIGMAGVVRQSALALGAAGVGLALLSAVPLGILPEHPRQWWPVPAVGVPAGVLCGFAVAVLAGMRQKRMTRVTGAAPST